jgi:hypothetical protein
VRTPIRPTRARSWALFACLLGVIPAGCDSSPAAGARQENKTAISNPSAVEPPRQTTFRFEEVTAGSGVDFSFRDGHENGNRSMVESLGGGVGMLDYDGDGRIDLFFPGGGEIGPHEHIASAPNGMFRNVSPWKYVEVTGPSGIGPAKYYNHGCATGDFDHDGFPDMLLTGYGGLQFYRNLGDGTFAEVSQETGLDSTSWSSSAAWGDLNGDGHLDLYVANYVDWSWENHPFCRGPENGQREACGPKTFNGLNDNVYYSQGDGTFREASQEAGLVAGGAGLGVLLADFDLNGALDIYVANDATDNFLYLNQKQGPFVEEGMVRGAAVGETGGADGSMGVDLCDFNGDGWPDIWVANFEREAFALYRNQSEGQFVHVSRSTGITALGGLFVAFGTVCRDFDRDGDEDMAVSNGHTSYYSFVSPIKQLPLLLENHQSRELFERVEFPADTYFGSPHRGRGLACGDLDDDGDLDLVISHISAPVSLLDNRTPPRGDYLKVRLIGTVSNRDAVGARLTLHTSSGSQARQISGGGSYCSQSDRTVFWGLAPGDKIDRLTVIWPSGLTQEVSTVDASRTLTLIEPTGEE